MASGPDSPPRAKTSGGPAGQSRSRSLWKARKSPAAHPLLGRTREAITSLSTALLLLVSVDNLLASVTQALGLKCYPGVRPYTLKCGDGPWGERKRSAKCIRAIHEKRGRCQALSAEAGLSGGGRVRYAAIGAARLGARDVFHCAGVNSPIRDIGCVAMRRRMSSRYLKGSTPASRHDAMME